jgi:hypothetical protein
MEGGRVKLKYCELVSVPQNLLVKNPEAWIELILVMKYFFLYRLIAVNYEARAKGVGRHMRGDDAMKACPEILLVKVPELRGKADLTK